ncbi:histone deacetylase [Plasmodium cynomolgi strain B]|uniref:histone deacetylase n=1 Tax=Plasmodium cynomolgi (strain B) TaxID=1120755 RepID=K6VA30_PLACD|nr:histone deacetylase [Plasmodium cynomolgi strain B]GAB66012.1 histone deacetylase [Plasmodium cynomolgi strain B]
MKNGIINTQNKNDNKQTPLKQDTIAHLKLPDKGAHFNNFIIEKFDNINDISLYLRESNNLDDSAQQVVGDDAFMVDLIGAVDGGALRNGDLRSSHERGSSARSSRNGGTPPLRRTRNKSNSQNLTNSNQNGSLSSSYKRRKSGGESESPRRQNREAKKILNNKYHEGGRKGERKRRSKSDINQGDRKKKKSNEKREFINAKQGLGIRNNMINKNESKGRNKLQKGYSVRKKRQLRRGKLLSTSSSNDGEFGANKYILDKIFLSLKKKGNSMEQLNNSFYIEYDESADLGVGGEEDTDSEVAEGDAPDGFSVGVSAGFSANVKFSASGGAARGAVLGAPDGGSSSYADNALEEYYPPEPPKNLLLRKNKYHTHCNTNKAHKTRNGNHLYKYADSNYKDHQPDDLKNGKILSSPKSGNNNVEYDCIGFVCDEEYMCQNLHFDENHVESPDRIKCIIKALKEKNVINKMVQIKCREALYDEIKECHTSSHINNIFYSLKRKLKYKKKDVIYPFDKHDTYYTSYTGTVSKRAVGGLLNLCDAILSNKNEKFKYIDFKKSFRYNYNFFKNISPNGVRSFMGNRINHNTHLKRSKSESNLYVMSRFEARDIGSSDNSGGGGGSGGGGLGGLSGNTKNKQPSNAIAKRGTHKAVSTSNYCYSGNQATSEAPPREKPPNEEHTREKPPNEEHTREDHPNEEHTREDHPNEDHPNEDHPNEVPSPLAEPKKEESTPCFGEASSPQEGANLTDKVIPPEKPEAGTQLTNVIEEGPPTNNPSNRKEVPIFNKPFRSYSTSMCSVRECTTNSNSFTDINCGFAAIRPPGHHCSRNSPAGFCIFNNISVACKYIFKKYGIRKILIFDWDVHHDNGTQEIFYSDKDVLCFSIHRFDKKKDDGKKKRKKKKKKKKKGEGVVNKGSNSAAGGGTANGEKGKKKDGCDDNGKGSKGRKGEINKSSSKTFKADIKGSSILDPALGNTEDALSTTLDARKTATISSDSSNGTPSNATHSDDTKKKKKKKGTKDRKNLKSYEENLFYPRTGAKSELGSKSGYKFNINVPLEKGYNNCDVYYVFKYLLLPVLENFQPEFIFISCGFDASINDPLGECNLTHNFYQWMTLQLKNFANIFCKGRIILVLEGGYNLNYLPKCTLACIKALIKKNKNRKKEYPLMHNWQWNGKPSTDAEMIKKGVGLSRVTPPNGVLAIKEALPTGVNISEPKGSPNGSPNRSPNRDELTPSNDSAFNKMQNWRQVKHGSLINNSHKDNDHVNFYKFKCYSDYYKTSNKNFKHVAGKTYTNNMTSKKKELLTTGKLHYSTYKVIKYFLCILKGDPFHLNIKLPPYNSFLKKNRVENKKLSLDRKISIFKKVDSRADHLRRDGGNYSHYGEGHYQYDLHRGVDGSPDDAPYDEEDGGIMNFYMKKKIEQMNRHNQTYKKHYSLSSTTISNLSHSDLYISNDELDYNSSSSDSSRSSKRKVILLNKLKLKISKHGNMSSAPTTSRPFPKMEKRKKRQRKKEKQKQKQRQKQRQTFSTLSDNNQEFKGMEIWDLTKVPEQDDITHVSNHSSSEGAVRAGVTAANGGMLAPNLSLAQCPPHQSDHHDVHLGFDLTNLKYCQDQLQNSFTMYTQRKKGFIFFYGSGHRNQWVLPAHKKITRIIKLCSDLEAYFYAWLYLCCGKEMCISGTMVDYASFLEDKVTVEGFSLSVDLSEEQKRQAKELLKFTVPCYHSFLKKTQLRQLGYQEEAPQSVEVMNMVKECHESSGAKEATEDNHNWKEQNIEGGLHEKDKDKSNLDDNSKENSKNSVMTLNFDENCTSQNVNLKSESNCLFEHNDNEKNVMEQKRSDNVSNNPSSTKQSEPLLKGEENKTAICLANVLSTMRHPCVMDVKMGVRLYGDDCDEDSIQKKIQKAKSRSCLSHGFHLTSVIGWDKKKEEPFFISKEDAHSIKNDDNFVDAFMSYFLACDNVHLSKMLLKKLLLVLEHMKAFFESQHLFAFYGTSLLFVFDSDPSKNKNDGDGSAEATENQTGEVTGNQTGEATGNQTGEVTGNQTGEVTGNQTGEVTELAEVSSANLVVDPEEERSNKMEKEDHEDIFNFREKMQSIFEDSLTSEERDIYMQSKLNCKILKSANVYIIDFAHASLNRNQKDEGFLLGITSLHRIMKKTIEKIETLYHP